jgi:hypothetical protein
VLPATVAPSSRRRTASSIAAIAEALVGSHKTALSRCANAPPGHAHRRDGPRAFSVQTAFLGLPGALVTSLCQRSPVTAVRSIPPAPAVS